MTPVRPPRRASSKPAWPAGDAGRRRAPTFADDQTPRERRLTWATHATPVLSNTLPEPARRPRRRIRARLRRGHDREASVTPRETAGRVLAAIRARRPVRLTPL